MTKKKRFKDEWVKELVIEDKLASSEEMATARHYADRDSAHLIDVLVEQNIIEEKVLYRHIARKFNLELLDLQVSQVKKELLETIGAKFCSQRMIIPILETEDVLKVLIANPIDMDLQNDLGFRFPKKIVFYLGTRKNIAAILDHFFSREETSLDSSKMFTTDAPIDIVGMSNKGLGADPEISKLPIIRLTKHIIAAAIRRKVTKIHLEPVAKTIKVYFEADGKKKAVVEYPEKTGGQVINRSKFIAGISVDKQQGPQTGRCRIKTHFNNVIKNYELRVSSLPSSFGEKIILNLLDKEDVVFRFEDLGMLPQVRFYVEKLLRQAHGLVILASPPSMGKTTTLYSCLQQKTNQKANIYTVENTIHFSMEGMTQLEVNEKEGNTGAILIRSAKKQNPDVLAVDSVHDALTAESIGQAAQGKTLVLATMTANTALDAIIHLINLGVSRKAIGTSLKAIILQRLVLKICPHCKTQTSVPQVKFDLTGLMAKRGLQPRFFKGKGCKHCNMSGFKGKLGMFEIFPITRGLARSIADGSTEADLKLMAKQIGIRSLLDYSLAHISLGHTTIRELQKFIDLEQIFIDKQNDSQRIPKFKTAQSTNNGNKKTILVAEDNVSVRAVIKVALMNNGFNVLEAKDGQAAMQFLKRAKPDLLLLDINMPNMSGLDVLRQVKAHPSLHNLPVVMLTANSQAQMEFDALEGGADDYIVKPFRPELLAARVRTILRRQKPVVQKPAALAA